MKNQFLKPNFSRPSRTSSASKRAKLHEYFWHLADEKRLVRWIGQTVELTEALPILTRLQLFERAFEEIWHQLLRPDCDWSLDVFGEKLEKRFLEHGQFAWLESRSTADFLKIYRATPVESSDRERLRHFLELKTARLRAAPLFAWVNGKKWWLHDLLTETEQAEPFADAFRQFLAAFDDGSFKGTASWETFFRTIFFRRCVDFYRRKTTVEKRMGGSLVALDALILPENQRLADQIEAADVVEKLEKREAEFAHPTVKRLLGEWRAKRFPCFFLIIAQKSRGLTAKEIFDLLAADHRAARENWLRGESVFYPPLTRRELRLVQNRWTTMESLASTAASCFAEFKKECLNG